MTSQRTIEAARRFVNDNTPAQQQPALLKALGISQIDVSKGSADGVRQAYPIIADPFARLDHALAGVRLLSKAIASAAERGDARAIRGLSDLREQLSDDVTVLLRETVVELPECLR